MYVWRTIIYIYIYIYYPPSPLWIGKFPLCDCPMPFTIRTLIILIKSGMDVEIFFIHYYI